MASYNKPVNFDVEKNQQYFIWNTDIEGCLICLFKHISTSGPVLGALCYSWTHTHTHTHTHNELPQNYKGWVLNNKKIKAKKIQILRLRSNKQLVPSNFHREIHFIFQYRVRFPALLSLLQVSSKGLQAVKSSFPLIPPGWYFNGN